MRPLLLALGLAVPAFVHAQNQSLTRADSMLVGRMLRAEDRRDSSDVALVEGARHTSARVRLLARRARARIVDPLFTARDSFASLPAPPSWPEPAWRMRYRELTTRRDDCATLRTALSDTMWPVRLHAADLARASCAGDDTLVATLRAWLDSLPGDVSRRARGSVSWHAAAHGIVALARLRPDEARSRIGVLADHEQWHLRLYAARAATVLRDTARLRMFARDSNENVTEAAITALAGLTGHADDDLYIAALESGGAQAVRAAALALDGSPRADARAAANAAFERWVERGNASERDVRVALLAAAGRPESDDRPPSRRGELPLDAIRLALGRDVRLRITTTRSSGGGAFIVRLRGDVAPVMAGRILALVRDGYYDGLTWHRVEHDFVIQGGSPGDNEYVGHPVYIRDELGTVPHVRGTVGMSTRGHDTGDAQWFINLKDNPRLGGAYTVFAEVIEGIDVVDGILEGDTIERIVEVGYP